MTNRILLLLIPLMVSPLLGQRLPTGTYQPDRERTYDLVHLKATLAIDWEEKSVRGEAMLHLRPLAPQSSFALDAYWLNVSAVHDGRTNSPLSFALTDSTLMVQFPRPLGLSDTASVVVKYSATPTAGMYFIEPCPGTNHHPAIFTYGEGGIHANWLPLYNDVNDKFSTEMIVTVNKPHTAISNGRLVASRENSDGTRTFHWSQANPHSDYLIALFVGDYRAVPLRSALGTIPLTAWVHPGQEDQARFVFQRTPEMVEFFSERLGLRYPWEKYDQVAAYDYAIGAMENTSITGHNNRILRNPGQTEEFGPQLSHFNSNWTAESIISHELVHHWFGNNTTCRSLANIWMNESFASYLMMVWDEHRLGQDYLQSQTWFALQSYLSYVADSHLIRPLEYRYFDTREEMYNTETTYQKGAIVLHMLRWVLGDEDFFRSLAHIQQAFRFSNVESADLLQSIREASGKNVEWFFEQWVWGGGHPVFEVSSSYLPAQKKTEIVIEQIQPLVEGQGLFTLPVEIRIDAGGESKRSTVWVRERKQIILFDTPSAPELVSVDGRGRLVADIRHRKSLADLVIQVKQDDLSGRLRALHQMIASHGADPAVPAAIRWILESDAHWSLKAESVLLLKKIPSPDAERLLLRSATSADYHIRKAAAVALGFHYTDASRAALRSIIEKDRVDDVSAAAIVSLARIDGSSSLAFLEHQSKRESWYHVRQLAVLRAVQILAADHRVPAIREFLPLVRRFSDLQYHYALREQALRTWSDCAPEDPQLHDRLIIAASTDILPVRSAALELLGILRVERALSSLREIVRRNGDSDIRAAAREAIESIDRARSN